MYSYCTCTSCSDGRCAATIRSICGCILILIRDLTHLEEMPMPDAQRASFDLSPSPSPIPKHTRSRAGCLTCRKRRKGCDRSKPICGACDRLKLVCLRLFGTGSARRPPDPSGMLVVTASLPGGTSWSIITQCGSIPILVDRRR
jgi:hypothetical protein